jgi:acyl-CoA synthetase (AMP-forming)/AMP-acid ligase II
MSLSQDAPIAAADPLTGVTTLCELFQATAARVPDLTALRTVGGDIEISWGEYGARVRSIAAGLAAIGVRRGAAVAIMLT